jgi:hypothetical protein
VIDIEFYMLDSCVAIGEPPPAGSWGFVGYLPAGTYVARRILISETGERTIENTLTFTVLESGPPLLVPTLSSMHLATLALLLAAVGAIATRHT